MRKLTLLLSLCVATVCLAIPAKGVYSFTLKSIDGQPVSLRSYHGKVLLLVNVASKCGYTPQYAGLESLYEKYKDRGLVIVGIPANNFASQEPGTNEEIKKFCHNRYNVSFPMMGKVSVVGADKTPLSSHPTHPRLRRPSKRHLITRTRDLVLTFSAGSRQAQALNFEANAG